MQGARNRIAILAIGIGVGLLLRSIFLPGQPDPAAPKGAGATGKDRPGSDGKEPGADKPGADKADSDKPGKGTKKPENKPPETDASQLEPLVPPIVLAGPLPAHAVSATRLTAADARDELAWLTAGNVADDVRPRNPMLQAALGKGLQFKFNQLTHFPAEDQLPGKHPSSSNDYSGHGAQRITSGEFAHGQRAVFEPHGDQVCASGCAASRHPTTPLVTNEFHQLLRQFASQPITEDSPAFEKLLYFGKQTQQRLQRYGCQELDPVREMVLHRELKKTHAQVQIRLVDEHGEIRSWLPPTLAPLDRRHVFDMEAKGVQPLVTSGTVKRVGLHHVWTRL